MTPDQITALAREYAEWICPYKDKSANLSILDIREAERLINFLLRRYCLVEKSKVQAVYKTSKEIVNNEQYGTCQYSMHTQIMCVLENLFGSKCLPDGNKECSNPSVVNCKHKHGDGTCSLSGMCCYKSPKPAEPEEKDDCQKFTKRLDDTLEGDIKEPFKEWRDKNSSNVEKLEKNGEVEPKPAEPKFAKGDMIHCKFFGYEGDYRVIGYTDGSPKYYACIDKDGFNYRFPESDLEPYTEPTEESLLNVNHSDIDISEIVAKGYVPDPAKHFDNILKDSFSKERRLNIAAMITQGIMANPSPQMVEMDVHRVADLAILMADTLIAECEKGGRK